MDWASRCRLILWPRQSRVLTPSPWPQSQNEEFYSIDEISDIKSTSWTYSSITLVTAFSLQHRYTCSNSNEQASTLPSHRDMLDTSRKRRAHDLSVPIFIELTCGVYFVKAVVVVPYRTQTKIIIQLEGTHLWLSCSITASKSEHRNLSSTTCEINCLHVLRSSDEALRKHGKSSPRVTESIRVHGWMEWCKREREEEEEEHQRREGSTWQSRTKAIRINTTHLESIRINRTCASGNTIANCRIIEDE